MGLDIRLPIGLMFVAIGAIVTGFGLVQNIGLDRTVGAAMLGFGTLMVVLARRSS